MTFRGYRKTKKRKKISDQLKQYEESLLKKGEKYDDDFLGEPDEPDDFEEELFKAGKVHTGDLFMGGDFVEDEEDEDVGPGTLHGKKQKCKSDVICNRSGLVVDFSV